MPRSHLKIVLHLFSNVSLWSSGKKRAFCVIQSLSSDWLTHGKKPQVMNFYQATTVTWQNSPVNANGHDRSVLKWAEQTIKMGLKCSGWIRWGAIYWSFGPGPSADPWIVWHWCVNHSQHLLLEPMGGPVQCQCASLPDRGVWVSPKSKTTGDIQEVGNRTPGTARVEDCIYEICFAWAAATETKPPSSLSPFKITESK